MSAVPDPRECPYVGLDPFDSAHTDYFFGRRRESKIIADHVVARPLTVLYGPSGVGKSSILNVGVPVALRKIFDAVNEQMAEADAEAPVVDEAGNGAAGTVDWTVRSWREWQELDRAEQVMAGWSAETFYKPVLIILDQFEEYFLYRDRSQRRSLDKTFGDLIARRDSQLHLLLCLRDDALHQLDQLRAFVPGILETMIELRGLDDSGTRDAIIGPITRYNEKFRDGRAAITVEGGLVAELIRQLREADITIGSGRATSGEQRRVELPYLQLALTKLWNAERGAEATALRELNFSVVSSGACRKWSVTMSMK